MVNYVGFLQTWTFHQYLKVLQVRSSPPGDQGRAELAAVEAGRFTAKPHSTSWPSTASPIGPRACSDRMIAACDLPRASRKLDTGTTTSYRIDVDEDDDRSAAMTVTPSAIGAATEIGRATS